MWTKEQWKENIETIKRVGDGEETRQPLASEFISELEILVDAFFNLKDVCEQQKRRIFGLRQSLSNLRRKEEIRYRGYGWRNKS